LPLSIQETTRQTLYLICKEAINNTAKYAEATTCNIDLHIIKNTIHCSITDNGKGFDTTSSTNRNGLLNMQLSTTRLKGKLHITSRASEGTRVVVELPVK
jgi:signal transduction histidine kinase